MPYDRVSDVKAFMKRKRTIQYVILTDQELPRECHRCHKTVEKGHSNRTDILPTKPEPTVKCMHYICSWGGVFEDIEKITDNFLIG